MRNARRSISTAMFLEIVAPPVCWLLFSVVANAQGPNLQGQNAVCTSSGCSTQAASSAFIDASMFTGSTANNFCAVLQFVLSQVVQPIYPGGRVPHPFRVLCGRVGGENACRNKPTLKLSSRAQ
jgi:hypothetical protein